MNVLVCWEDTHHQELHQTLKKVFNTLFKPHAGDGPWPELRSITSKGNGSFRNVVDKDWPNFRRYGLSGRCPPFDHLVCIADADKLYNLRRQIPSIVVQPKDGSNTDVWADTVRQQFTSYLRGDSDDPSVHGEILRWSAESLLIAAHDVLQYTSTWSIGDLNKLRRHLDLCSESPGTTQDEHFVHRHQHGEDCFRSMELAAGMPMTKKGGATRSRLLTELNRDHLELLRQRVPDLDRIARKIVDIVNEPSPC